MILAASRWNTNADMIVDCAELGYLKAEWRTLDPTFGRGIWWKKFRPDDLVTYCRPQDGYDFRMLPHPSESFDAIAFDPPYVASGGRKTTGMPEFHDRFGMTDCPASPALLQDLIVSGLAEMRRLIRPRGFVLVKCQDYVSSGHVWHGTYKTHTAAEALGFEVWDRMERVQPNPRPQPKHNGEVRPQKHARRNLSTLLVLKAPR